MENYNTATHIYEIESNPCGKEERRYVLQTYLCILVASLPSRMIGVAARACAAQTVAAIVT